MRKIALFLIVLLTIVSCKKDEPVSPDFSDIFVGTWTATTLKGSGNTISLVGIKDPALYMVITRVANNKLNATLSSYSNGQTTKSGTLTFDIAKNGDTYTFTNTTQSSSNSSVYFKYSMLTGELLVGGLSSNGSPIEATFKK
ncbi:lipocalin family protein [Arcicella aquatica]|uniref:Lipocalin family protein n=1 Tax=Arcicella aquatica TaxID=217141 RepID=A0ABU5QSD5_9BACT|nr:lipocalin family protein [Arcicella aquatica]MEA5260002.1 lipocalin family protein [Arcicella aquatica]